MFIAIIGDFPASTATKPCLTASLREQMCMDWRDLQRLGRFIREYWRIIIPPDDWADIDTIGELASYIGQRIEDS